MAGCRHKTFLPIEDYGVIGNLHTVALVSKQDASIDYFCFPRFDSPFMFSRLLTSRGGGYFQITPAECQKEWTAKQLYLPSSNVLVTRFLGSTGGVGQVTDFLPVTETKNAADLPLVEELLRRKVDNIGPKTVSPSVMGWPWLIRKVETIRGYIQYNVKCQPAFDYGRASHTIQLGANRKQAIFESNDISMELSAYFFHDTTDGLEWHVLENSYEQADGAKVSQPSVEKRKQ